MAPAEPARSAPSAAPHLGASSPASTPPPESPRQSVAARRPQAAWDLPVKYIKGVGPKISELLGRAEIRTLWDLLLFLPRTYEDRRRFHDYSEISRAADTNESVMGLAKIVGYAYRQAGRGGRRWLEARAEIVNPQEGISNDPGALRPPITFLWFHGMGASWEKRFPPESFVLFRGKVQGFRGRLQLTHPELQPADAKPPPWDFGGFVPIYREVSGLSTRLLRRILWEALSRPEFTTQPEGLPQALRERHALPSFRKSVEEIHFPKTWEPSVESPGPDGRYLERIAFEELFFMAVALHLRRAEWRAQEELVAERVPVLKTDEKKLSAWKKSLPFALTGDQETVLGEVLRDMARQGDAVAMHRLVQGDVGSGKTVVAFLAALTAIENGYQAAFMAPTEILADQHYRNFSKMFPERAHEVLLLKGALTAAKKDEAREKIRRGEARFIIGTQALLTDKTFFDRLGLVIVDEQHRFGVEQRLALRRFDAAGIPHLLVMTATPIPRSLALTLYGDLHVSSIREKPPGRKPIRTHVVHKRQRPALVKRVRALIDEGRQAYVVYPLVEESEELDLKDVKTAFEEWTSALFPHKVELLHGKMKPADKDRAMRAFSSGEARALISTTVIEVGVDVPAASVMVIEHAERFGLAQLHQLRGRVGRGTEESFCVLVGPDSQGALVSQRLQALATTEDGFRLAELDLELRGPGEFLGRRQSGLLGFRVANLVRDVKLMEIARAEARSILEADPTLTRPENQGLRVLLRKWWEGRIELTHAG